MGRKSTTNFGIKGKDQDSLMISFVTLGKSPNIFECPHTSDGPYSGSLAALSWCLRDKDCLILDRDGEALE